MQCIRCPSTCVTGDRCSNVRAWGWGNIGNGGERNMSVERQHVFGDRVATTATTTVTATNKLSERGSVGLEKQQQSDENTQRSETLHSLNRRVSALGPTGLVRTSLLGRDEAKKGGRTMP